MVDNHVSSEILFAVVATIEHFGHYPIAFDDDVMARSNASAAHGVENDNDRQKTGKMKLKKEIKIRNNDHRTKDLQISTKRNTINLLIKILKFICCKVQ